MGAAHDRHPNLRDPVRTFLGVTRTNRDAAYVVAGIPLDIGTTNRAGARDGPQAIRRASRMLTDGDAPDSSGSSRQHSTWPTSAIFRIALGDIPASLQLIEQQAAGMKHLLALGGEHGITLPLLRALATAARPAARAGAFRRACRYLADQFRPGLCARLGVLPRHRGGPGRSAPHDPDRHPLAGAARRVGLDAWAAASRC